MSQNQQPRQNQKQQQQLVNQQRKFGIVPKAVDAVTGNEISPFLPQSLTTVPFYVAGGGGGGQAGGGEVETLMHQSAAMHQKSTQQQLYESKTSDVAIKEAQAGLLCAKCGKKGHALKDCLAGVKLQSQAAPKERPGDVVSSSSSYSSSSKTLNPVSAVSAVSAAAAAAAASSSNAKIGHEAAAKKEEEKKKRRNRNDEDDPLLAMLAEETGKKKKASNNTSEKKEKLDVGGEKPKNSADAEKRKDFTALAKAQTTSSFHAQG